MRVSVIPNDKIIIIDGNGITSDDWNFDDDHIHAIQWFHEQGHIELKTNEPNIEINDISFVQPYIDKYMEIIPIIKEKALKAKEEERLRAQKEEAEIKKYEEKIRKEQEDIKKLQEQNKKIREEKLRLETEASHLIEQVNNVKLHYDIELERKELEKQAELESLKNNAIMRELIDKETNIVSNYEEFKKQVNKEIETSKKEQEKFLELISQHQNIIDAEKEKLEKTKKLFDEQIQFEREKLELQRQMMEEENLNYRYKLDYEKDTAIQMKNELELETDKLLKEKEELKVKEQKSQQEFEIEKIEMSQKKSNLQYQQDILEKQKKDASGDFERLAYLRSQEEDKIKTAVKKIESTNEQIQKQLINNLEYDNVSIEDLVNIMNELDPEEVYTSLTSGEIDENNFPVEKAVTWFSALKKAIDSKE